MTDTNEVPDVRFNEIETGKIDDSVFVFPVASSVGHSANLAFHKLPRLLAAEFESVA